jgi:hypothetical protein
MRRRFSYANVAATVAIVLAMSGGAYAAGHYLINSTKQINPKVLRKLHGARGARGVAGQIGAIGPQGVTGATGPKGARGPDGESGEPGFSALSRLPTGKSESGVFAVTEDAATEGHTISTAITFSIPLEVPVEGVEFTPISTKTVNCLGPGSAHRGWLCIYTSSVVNAKSPSTSNLEVTGPNESLPGKFGAGLSWAAENTEPPKEPEHVSVAGTYTVTAP